MPQHLGNLLHRGAAAEHRGSEAVPKKMRTVRGGRKPRSPERPIDDCPNGAAHRESAMRCKTAQEDKSGGARRPSLAEIEADRPPDVYGQRESIMDLAFSANNELSLSPTQVVELERHHLARAQAKTRQQQKDGVVPPARRRRPVTCSEEPLDVFRRHVARHGDRLHHIGPRHGSGEVRRDVSRSFSDPTRYLIALSRAFCDFFMRTRHGFVLPGNDPINLPKLEQCSSG